MWMVLTPHAWIPDGEKVACDCPVVWRVEDGISRICASAQKWERRCAIGWGWVEAYHGGVPFFDGVEDDVES